MIQFVASEGFAELGTKDQPTDNQKSKISDQDSDQVSDQDRDQYSQKKRILEFCVMERTLEDIMQQFGMSHRTYFRRTYINPLLDDCLLKMMIPDKPTSKNQRYVTTKKGRELIGK